MKLLDCVLGFRESNTLMGAEMALWVWMRRLVIPAGPDEREQNARPMGVLGPSSLSFSFCLCSCQVFIISCCGVIAFCWCWYKGLAHLMLQLASLKGPQIITIPRIRYWLLAIGLTIAFPLEWKCDATLLIFLLLLFGMVAVGGWTPLFTAIGVI